MTSVTAVLTSRYFAVGTAAAIAAVASSLLTKRHLEQKLEAKYADIADQQIHEAKAFYRAKFKSDEYADPAKLAEKYQDDVAEALVETAAVQEASRIIAENSYTPYNKPEEIATPTVPEVIEVNASIQKNIFDNREPITHSDDTINVDLVNKQKENGHPYIVSHDEFFENNEDWSQTTLSWFEADESMADEDDSSLTGDWVDKNVGYENLLFGVESKDANVVYIANPNLQGMYEITKSTGSFAQEVMGIQPTLSSRRR